MNKIVQFKIKWLNNKSLISISLAAVMFVAPTSLYAKNEMMPYITIEQQIKQKRVSLNITNKPIRVILSEIKNQSGIGFIIKDSKMEQELSRLSIHVENVTVETALATLLKNTNYDYKIVENLVTLIKKESKPALTDNRISVNGKVLDSDTKRAIAGATVLVLGTTSGAISDADGSFKLTVKSGQQLEISFMGLATEVVTVGEDGTISVLLKKDAMAVDDVVITGYGDVKRSSYTGNAVTVGRDQLLKASKTNVIKALQSFDPSFRIKENNQWGSDPNAMPEVYIRGESGIGVKALDKDGLSKSQLKDNPNLPTFIMDGFEISVTKLYDFDPNRIESVTILKDAAATALYGSRAANGVVVITTVAPKAGKINVTYNFTGDITFPDLSDYNLTNAAEKLEIERKAGFYTPDGTYTDRYEKEQEYFAKLANVKRGVDTYWLSKPLNSVFNHKHSLYIDGGGENLRFGFDVNYTNQDGVMKGSLRDRMGAGFYINYQYKGLSVKNSVTYNLSKSKESPYGSFSMYADALPYNEYLDENGNYLEELRIWKHGNELAINPLYESGLNNFDRSTVEDIINNLSINWNLTKSLLFKAQLSLTKEMGKGERFLDPLSKLNRKPLSLTNLSSGELTNTRNDAFSYDITAYLSYNKNFGKHNLNVLAGLNIKDRTESASSEYFEGFPSGVLSSPNYAQSSPDKPSYAESTNRLAGFMGSLNYSYNDIYLFDVSARMDGSSAFGSENRFAPFWSLGAGINIHNYEFMKGNKVINQLKIRGSYGQVGKANFPAYTARTSYVSLTDEWYKTGYGVVLQALGNKNLSWETTNTFDIGPEIGLLNNLLYVKASYYHKKTVDLINDVTIPSSTGFLTYKDNIGEILNEGYEIDFRASVLRKRDMSLILNANMAHNKNKIVKISESLKAYNDRVNKKFEEANSYENAISVPFVQYTEGGSMNSIWGVLSQGINPATGEEVFVSRTGGLTDTWLTSNQQILGTTEPKGQGSVGLNFSYKRFSVYASFMYEFGAQRYNQTLVDKVENADIYRTNSDKRLLTDRWSQVGDKAKYSSLKVTRQGVSKTRPTSRFVQDYNMLSLNAMTFSYDLSENVLKPLHMSMVRLELGVNDLFHLSTVKQERGLSYPFARSFNFSVKATF